MDNILYFENVRKMCERFVLNNILSECTQLPIDIISKITRFLEKKPKKEVINSNYIYINRSNFRSRHKYLSDFFILQ